MLLQRLIIINGLLGAAGHSSKIDGGGDFVAKDTDIDTRKKSSTLRLMNQLVAEFGKKASLSFVTLYTSVDSGGVKEEVDVLPDADPSSIKEAEELPKLNELLFAVRPSYYLSDTTALTFSYSFNKVENYAVDSKGDWIDGTMQKITVAPEFSMAQGYWSRPKLRLFATYATWNEELKDNGLMAKGTTYANDTSGFSAGAQFEVWW